MSSLNDFSEFLVLFNLIAKEESRGRAIEAKSEENVLNDLGLDSMDQMTMGIFFSDWWGIPKNLAKTFQPTSVGQFFSLLVEHGKTIPLTMEECLCDYGDFWNKSVKK